MKKIELTNNAGFCIVDDDDYENVKDFKWALVKGMSTNYARKTSGKKEMMHRMLLNARDGFQVDHVNHDGLDNRRCNIRECTRSENMKNVRPYGTSKYLGVNLHTTKSKHTKKDGTESNYTFTKWRAAIAIKGKIKHLGLFEYEIDAAKKYDEYAKMHHGEFANLNFKDSK